MDSCVQPKKESSPAMKLTTAPAHPWAELTVPVLVTEPSLADGDVVTIAVLDGDVSDEGVPLMTLSLEVAKILRDLISSRNR